MKWYNYAVQYWAQMAVLIAAVGYVAKVFLDFYFKRKEIGINVFTKAKLDALARAFTSYEKMRKAAFNAIMFFQSPFFTPDDNVVLTFEKAFDEFSGVLDEIRFLISAKEFVLFFEIDKKSFDILAKLQVLEVSKKMNPEADKQTIGLLKKTISEISVIHEQAIQHFQEKFR